MKIRYRTLGRTSVSSGIGLVVNMSSGGAMVVSKNDLRAGARVEVCMEWPLLLEGSIRLQLVTVGQVVRRGEEGFAVEFERYQFKTMRSVVQEITPPASPLLQKNLERAASA